MRSGIATVTDFRSLARDPDSWLRMARGHRSVAEVLWCRYLDVRGADLDDPRHEESKGCFLGFMLHAGLAVENAAKGALIAKKPRIVEGPKLNRRAWGRKGGHELGRLVDRVLDCLSEEETDLLARLEQSVRWTGKYPVPLEGDRLSWEGRQIDYPKDHQTLDELLERLYRAIPASGGGEGSA